MTRFFRTLWRMTWFSVAFLLIATAAILTLLRLALPFASGYQAAIEARVGDYLGAEVTIGELDLEWHRFGPRLRLDGVSVRHPDGAVLGFEQAFVDFGPVWSLTDPRVRDLTLAGLELDVTLDAAGNIHFWGMVLNPASLLPAVIDDEREIELAAAGDIGGDFATGLLAVDRLQLVDTRVRITDAAGERYRIEALDVRMVNDGDRNRLAITGRPPAAWGEHLEVIVDARNLLADTAAATGEIYVDGQGLALGRWRSLLAEYDLPAAAGRGDLEAWVEWDGARLERVLARGAVQGLEVVAGEDRRLRLVSLEGTAHWQRQVDGWRVDVADLAVSRDGTTWGAERTGIDRSGGRWRLRADFLPIGDLVDLARLLPGAATAVAPLAERDARGGLHDVRLAFDRGDAFLATAGFTDLGWTAGDRWPGIRGLDGRLRASPRGGEIDLDAADVRFDHPRLFRDPLAVDRLAGTVDVHRDADGIRIETPSLRARNSDIRTETRMMLAFGDGRSPWLDMQVDFADGDAATTSRYLPTGIMDPELVDWLDRSIVDGRVVAGTMLFHGRTADFPFEDAPGVFDVDFELVDARLDYAPDWPALDDLDARVHFHGAALDIDADRARIHDSPIASLSARFADLTRGDLRIDAGADAKLADLVRVVNESPLQQRLGAFFDGARTGEGTAGLELGLDIPVQRAQDTRVDGQLRLAGNRLAQPRFGLDFTAAEGTVAFTEDSVTIEDLAADLNGQAITLDARTRASGLQLHARGDLAIPAMLPVEVPAMDEWLDGAAPWDIRVHLDGVDDSGLPARTRIEAESDLVGTAVRLPEPFAKARDESRRLRLTLPLIANARHHRLEATYGDTIRFAGELDTAAPGLHRAALHFGDTGAELPPRPGLYLGGDLARVDLDAWQRVLAAADSERGPAPAGAADGPVSGGLAGADLRADRVRWRGRELTDVDFAATRADDRWRLDVASDEVSGEIDWPRGTSGGRPVRVRLEWLDLGRLQAGPEAGDAGDDEAVAEDRAAPAEGLHPADLPPFDIRVERLLYDELTLRDLALVTAPVADGLMIHRLEAGNPSMQFEGQGEWHRSPTRGEQTRLRVRLDTDDFGAGLLELGNDSGFEDGHGRIVIEADWSGPPWSPELPSLSGQMRIRLDDGLITAIDPGPARLISLFSLETLPRRLSLDFGTLLRGGFEYDRIRGRLNFEDGNAWIGKLEMIGPPGRARVNGRIGFVAEDFDQEIVFRPGLDYSLPVIGALAGGPAAGVAVAVVQQVMRGLGRDIETAAEVRYSLTGTWDDPKVERVYAESVAPADDAGEETDAVPRRGRPYE